MIRRSILTTMTGAFAILGAGCGYRHGDVVRDGNYRIELDPPGGPVFNGIFVDRQDGELVVTGFGNRPNPYGKVEVQIVGPNGEPLGEVDATILPPLAVPKRSYNYRFRAVLRFIPPDGSILRVLYSELRKTSTRFLAPEAESQVNPTLLI